MLLNIVLLIIGFVLLIRGADAFVDSAAALAHRFGIPEIIIGLTVFAMGTSAPEVAVSVSSVLHGAGGVAMGNVLGSNIVNVLLILGVSAIITPLALHQKTIKYKIPFVIFITLLLMWFCVTYGAINWIISLIFFCLFGLFLLYLYFSSRKEILASEKFSEKSLIKILVFLIVGLVALIFGSDLTVNSATKLADMLHVPHRIVGLTLIAFGTSLPELVTCITAARKKHTGLVVGNIIGSNIFNILFVLGITGLVRPIGFEYSFLIDAAISVFVMIMLWLIAIYTHELNRKSGILFLICYVAYLAYLI